MLALAPTLLLACAWLLLPGWVALRLVGVRGSLVAALAPAASVAMLGAGAVLAQLLGLRWGWLAALGSAALGGALALVLGRVLPAMPEALRWRRGTVAAAAFGLALSVTPALLVSGGDGYLQRWDAVFHLSALRLVDESGSASSLTLGALSYGDGRPAVYPAGWHALAALLPGSPTAVLVLAAAAAASVAWVLGCGELAAELDRRARPDAPPRASVYAVGAVLAGLATATPMSLWIGWGHVPNAAGLAMVPASVALGLRITRDRTGRGAGTAALAVALIGSALAHPNAALGTIVLLLPALVGVVVRRVRTALAAGRIGAAVATPVVAVAAVVLGVGALAMSPMAASVTGYTGSVTQSVATALWRTLVGSYSLWPSTTSTAIGVVALLGAVVALVRRQWLVPAMLALVWLLYADAATGGHLRLAGLWYSSSARISVLASAVVVPLAAVTVVSATAVLRSRAPRVRPAAVAAVATVAVVALAVPSVSSTARRTSALFDTTLGHPPQFVTADELAMIRTLPGTLDGGSILGSPFSGAASAHGLVGVPVVFPVAGQVWSADQETIMEHLPQIAAGTAPAAVCDALDRLDVRYLYQDSVPYQVDHRYEPLDTVEIADADVLAEADTARVVRLPACGAL